MKCPRCNGTGVIDEALHIFGGRVLARRKKLGLLQSELAKATGITQTMVSRIEGGTALPKIDQARAIAHALRTTPAKLVYPKDRKR